MLLPKNAFAWLLLVIIGFSCKSNTNIPAENGQITEDSVVNTDTASQENIADAPQVKTNSQMITALVIKWNLAHNNKDFNSLSKLYAEEVNLYGTVYSNAEAIAHKKQYFQQSKQTYQQLLGSADVVIHSAFVAKASFIKKVVSGKTTKNYNAYLMFEKTDNQWKIIAESDETADNERTQSKTAQIPVSAINSCEKAAEAVFRSSKYVQQMLKNPNTNFKLEYKPGDKNNPNNRYWFWVYANAPGGASTETYGRFQVDPTSGLLYEVDILEGKPKLIDSGSEYQEAMKKVCGEKL
ncbi:MAG: hypothetical protein ACXWDO_05840 [Bacteroidia bacterium]